MNTQQNLPSTEDTDRLRIENAELKKKIEREQVLYAMLHKDWKELSENASAYNYALLDNKPKNLFYKYAFFVLVIAIFPAYFFLNSINRDEKNSSPAQLSSVPVLPGDSTLTTDSVPESTSAIKNTVSTNETPASKQETLTQKSAEPPPPPVPAEEKKVIIPAVVAAEKKAITPDTAKAKIKTNHVAVAETPVTDSVKDLVYWEGWNAYYNKSKNHYKTSSARYEIWVNGYNDGRNDAKKILAKDSFQKGQQ